MFAKLHKPTMAGGLEAVIPMPWYSCTVRTQEGGTCKCASSTASTPHPTAYPTFSYVERKNPNNSTNQPKKNTKTEDAI